jgi:hypothetical protein
MPDQGLGGVRLLGGSGDACRVDDILLQLVRQSAYQLRAGLDYDIGVVMIASSASPRMTGPRTYGPPGMGRSFGCISAVMPRRSNTLLR